MTFREKIDKILSIKKIKLWKLAEISGLKTTLEKAHEENREMSARKTKEFLEKMGIDPDSWDSPGGPEFLPADMQGRPSEDVRQVSKDVIDIIEGNTEYLIIPRSVLKEHYRIVPLEQFEKDKKQMEMDAKELDERSRQIETLMEIIREFHSKPISIQLPDVKKA